MSAPEPRTAATVVLIRDADAGPEVLLLRRSNALVFAGGVWAFPILAKCGLRPEISLKQSDRLLQYPKTRA